MNKSAAEQIKTQAARPRTYFSYDQISLWIESLAAELQAEQFTGVVGILRGGAFAAICVAFNTGAPLHFMRYDRESQQAQWVGSPPPPGKLLVCEDVAGLGYTLAHCLELVQRTHPEHEVLTVVSDDYSRLKPRWTLQFSNTQAILPWERHMQTLAQRTHWYQGGAKGQLPMLPDHEYRFWGVDMDGVLCADLPSQRYADDLTACLLDRDELPPAPQAPSLEPETHVIVTARPEEDRVRTQAWLARHGLSDVAVHLRDPGVHDSTLEGSAHHKGHTATQLGCTDFLESCPAQSALIAAQWPLLRVYWWQEGRPLRILATRAEGL
jgi:hypoxanthine phosphoribosyltransferase